MLSWRNATVVIGLALVLVGPSLAAGATADDGIGADVIDPSAFAAAIMYPDPGQTVGGLQTVGMSTTAPWDSPKTFALSVDGVPVHGTAMVTGSTLWIAWNTRDVANGSRTLSLVVTVDGHPAAATQTVSVDNAPIVPPTAAIVYPTEGQRVSGSQTVGMSTTAAWERAKSFVLSVDGVPTVSHGMATGTTLWITWDTATVPDGSRALSLAVTVDGETITATRTVSVNNDPIPAPAPAPAPVPTSAPTPAPTPAPLTAAFTSPAAGAIVTGTTPVGMAVSGATPPTTFRLTISDGSQAETVARTLSATTASHDWDTTSLPDGAYTLALDVMDSAGTAATVTRPVTVSNTPAVPPTARSMGPLRVLATNPRYFTDGTGRAIYLTGSHTWETLVDRDTVDPPSAFDYTGYLEYIGARGHNFFRLWAWEPSRHGRRGSTFFNAPSPWMRTGPGTALDGRPTWDLAKLDQAYFDRLRSRVIEARDAGMYAAVMLFEGFMLQFGTSIVHPFDAANNVNDIDGDPDGDGKLTETHTLRVPAITAIQQAYVRKVVDTVNDLDNVLYEIANESGPYSTPWQYAMINYLKRYQAGKPQQHPVGMTFQYEGGTNRALLASPADWISPGETDPYRTDPPAATGAKVIISDTDHLGGSTGGLGRAWTWKSFTRGLNTIYMDPLDDNATREDARRAMGYTLAYARRMDLAAMTPQPTLCSTRYCLANALGPEAEVLVYLPSGGTTTVDLSAASGTFGVEWFNPSTGVATSGEPTTGGATRSFTAPFARDAVLYIGNR